MVTEHMGEDEFIPAVRQLVSTVRAKKFRELRPDGLKKIDASELDDDPTNGTFVIEEVTPDVAVKLITALVNQPENQ